MNIIFLCFSVVLVFHCSPPLAQPWWKDQHPFDENVQGVISFQRDFSSLLQNIDSRILKENKAGIERVKDGFRKAAYNAGSFDNNFYTF